MTKYFYDFEFIEDGHSIEPISIGIVSEDPDSDLYLINASVDEARILQHPWLSINVWPKLPHNEDGTLDRTNSYVVPKAVMREIIYLYLTKNMTIKSYEEVELWAYFGAYDHVCFAQLFGSMVNMPILLPRYTNELVQLWNSVGKPQKPSKPDNVHNALIDAKWNRDLYNICMKATRA